MKTDVNRGEETERILRLRCAGLSLRAIAARVGLSHTAVANRISEALAELVTPAAEEFRQLEAARLLDLTSRAYEVLAAADTGDLKLKAIDRLTKLSESRRKLWALDMPQPIDVALSRRSDVEGDMVGGALAAVLEVLQLDEEQRELAVRAAQAALLGEPLPVAPAPAAAAPVEERGPDLMADFRRFAEKEGFDPDEDDDLEDDDGE